MSQRADVRSAVSNARTLPFDEFIHSVGELAADDGSFGWLAGTHGVAAKALTPAGAELAADALVTIGHRGFARVTDGGFTGRWPSVVGAEHADWFLLACDGRHLLIPRGRVIVDVHIHPAGLTDAGIGDVAVTGLDVDDLNPGAVDHVFAAAAAASVVVGSAFGAWRRHVDQVRARLAISYGGDDIADAAAAEIARTASDIDASRLQIANAELRGDTAPFAQAIARARDAVDRLMASSRHALDASDPVTAAWRDVHAGYRLAAAIVGQQGRPRGM